MTIHSYQVWDGVLTLGATPLDVAGQVEDCAVVPTESVASTEDRPVLSGEVLKGTDDATYSYVLTGSLIQDLASDGVIAYSYANAGAVVAFTFKPSGDVSRDVTGYIRMAPLQIGGPVKTVPSATFTWAVVSSTGERGATPDFGASA